jgi:hypothetical protein
MDIRIENCGSACMVTPMTPAARAWIGEHVDLESWQWQGASFAIDPRYAQDLIGAMEGAGLTVDSDRPQAGKGR